MDLQATLAALRTAGYVLTPLDGLSFEPSQRWRVQFGQGPQASDTILTSAELIALVERFVVPGNKNAPALDLPQTVAMLRAAGFELEPVAPGYWQLTLRFGEHTSAQTLPAERLVQLGNAIATSVPGILRGGTPRTQKAILRPVDPVELCYFLYRLSWVRADDLVALCHYDTTKLSATLEQLAQKGLVVRGPEETWTLLPAGIKQISHKIPAGVPLPTIHDLLDPRLSVVVARLILDLRSLELSRLDLATPGLAGSMDASRSRSLLLTVAPEPRGIAWARNLAAQAAAAGVPVLHLAIELIEADRATSSALRELLELLHAPTAPSPLLPCLVTSDPRLVEVVQAETRRWRPSGPWAISSLRDAQEGRWSTMPSGQLAVDLGLALRQVQN